MIERIEALADAIAKQNGIHDPESLAYQARNPGLLKIRPGAHNARQDGNGNMVFDKLEGGYRSLIVRLEKQCSGRSRHRLLPTNSLRDLLAFYELSQDVTARKVVNFLRRALRDESITENTELGFFLIGGNNGRYTERTAERGSVARAST